jgi:hypothetical protein
MKMGFNIERNFIKTYRLTCVDSDWILKLLALLWRRSHISAHFAVVSLKVPHVVITNFDLSNHQK